MSRKPGSRKQSVGPPHQPVGDETDPLAHGIMQGVDLLVEFEPDERAGILARAVVHRIGDHLPSHLPENAHRPRHVHGRRHQDPDFPRLRFDKLLAEEGVFPGVAGLVLEDHAVGIDSGLAQRTAHGQILPHIRRVLPHQPPGAAGEDGLRLWIVADQLREGQNPFRRVVDGGLAPVARVRRAHGAAQHDDAVHPFRQVGAGKALLQRQGDQRGDRRDHDGNEAHGRRRHQTPPPMGSATGEQQHRSGGEGQHKEIARRDQKPQQLRQHEGQRPPSPFRFQWFLNTGVHSRCPVGDCTVTNLP